MSSFAESTEGTRRTSTRNPRRRQRTENDSFPSQPRRKRSKISTDTFAATIDDDAQSAHDPTQTQRLNGHVPGGIPGAAMNGHVRRSSRKLSVQPPETGQLEVALRGGKKTAVAKRAVKNDATTVLVWSCVQQGPRSLWDPADFFSLGRTTGPKRALLGAPSAQHSRHS